MLLRGLLLSLVLCSQASAVFILDNSLSVEDIETFGIGTGGLVGQPWTFERDATYGNTYLSSYAHGGVKRIDTDAEVIPLGSASLGVQEAFQTMRRGPDGLMRAATEAHVWREQGGQMVRQFALPHSGSNVRIASDESGNTLVSISGGIAAYDASGTQLFHTPGSGSNGNDDVFGVAYDDGTFYTIDRLGRIDTVTLAGVETYTGLFIDSQYITPTDHAPWGLEIDGGYFYAPANIYGSFSVEQVDVAIYRVSEDGTDVLAYGVAEAPREIRVQNGTMYIPGFALGTLDDFPTQPSFGLMSLMANGDEFIGTIGGVGGQLSGFGPVTPEPSSSVLLFGGLLIWRCGWGRVRTSIRR